MPRVRVVTLGCKVNQCDSEEIARALVARGCVIAGDGEAADVFIVNTCTVTGTADAKARKLIRKVAREHPQAALIVTGCYAQRDPRALGAIPGVETVVGNEGKGGIAEMLAARRPVCDGGGRRHARPTNATRTRAFAKLQDGCDHGCAYCAVPQARGRPASKPMERALAELRELAEAGAQEVVLCGIRLGAYGRESGDGSLASLLQELRGMDIPRIRLSSIEPMDFGDDLLVEIADHPRLCHHLHLPLQSGDDAVLAAMGRGYSSSDFSNLVQRVRAAWPDVAISADVMAGFPGETEEQFKHTAEFVRGIGFSRLHVFPYSVRPGTAAASRDGQVAAPAKRARERCLLAVAEELAQQAAVEWVGRQVSVLWEERGQDGKLSGLTEHYVRAHAPGPDSWIGRITSVTPQAAQRGELVVC